MKPEQFVKEVDENLICSICQAVFEDPVNCKDGHTFCSACIEQWLKTNKTCPLDNVEILDTNLPRNYVLCGIVDNLKVYCHPPEEKTPATNPGWKCQDAEKTCDWTGKLGDVKRHRGTCAFQQVRCPYENCIKTMQRRELEDHDKICDHKKVKCDEKCGLILTRGALANHKKNDCPEVRLPCPNGCKQKNTQGPDVPVRIKRKDLDNHVTNTCEMTVVTCPFQEQGCLVQVVRRDLDQHLHDNMSSHILLLGKQNCELNKKCWSLYEKVRSLHTQCTTLTEKNSALNVKTSLLTEQCTNLQHENLSLEQQCSTLVRCNSLLDEEVKKVKEELSTYVWTIHDYPTLSQKHPKGSSFRSRTFRLCGYKWYLVVYPNGDEGNEGHLSLYLCLSDSVGANRSSVLKPGIPSGEVTVTYRLTVICLVPGKEDFSYGETMVFDKTTTNTRLQAFMKSTEALCPYYCDFVNNNRLTVKCTISTVL